MLGAQRACSSEHRALVEDRLDAAGARRRRASSTRAGRAARSRSSTSSTSRLPWAPSSAATVAGPVERLALGLGEDVHDAGAPAVRLGAAEPQHVDVLAGDRADHVGAGHEDPALRAEDHDVGQRRAVRRAAGGGAEHHRDLRDLAGGLRHHLEDPADRVQRQHALGQPGAAGVPQADDRDAGRPSPGGRRRRRPGSPRRPSRRP